MLAWWAVSETEGLNRDAASLATCEISKRESISAQSYNSFWFLDMLMTEEKLAVEVAEIDGIKVDDVDMTKTCHDQILE